MISNAAAPSLIAEGSRFRGDLSFFSETYVFGIVEGDLYQQSHEAIRVGASGWVHGRVISQGPVVVEGRVEGDIESAESIRLLPTATVSGRIKAPRIEVQGGAVVNGDVKSIT